jgi:hypothetical protein
MVKSQLRHGNDLLAMDSLRECDVCIYCLLYTFALARCNNSSSLSPGQTRKHCFLPMFRHVSKSGQTLGNIISEKHRETSNVSEFARKHFCFSGSKFCFRNNVSMGGQTGKHLRKHQESQMSPQQCFLVCPGLYSWFYKSHL